MVGLLSTMTTIDYPMTIDSDTEDSQQPDPLLDHDLDPHFTFDLASDNLTHLLGQQELLQDDVVRRGTKPVRPLKYSFSAFDITGPQGTYIR